MEDINKIKLLINYNNRLTLTENETLITEASRYPDLLPFLQMAVDYMGSGGKKSWDELKIRIKNYPDTKTFDDFINDTTGSGGLGKYNVESILDSIDYKTLTDDLIENESILSKTEIDTMVDGYVNQLINSKNPLNSEMDIITRDIETKLKTLWGGDFNNVEYKNLVKQFKIVLRGKVINKLKTTNKKVFTKYLDDMKGPILRKILNNTTLSLLWKKWTDRCKETSDYLKTYDNLCKEYGELRSTEDTGGLEPEDLATTQRIGELINAANTELRILIGNEEKSYNLFKQQITTYKNTLKPSEKQIFEEFETKIKELPHFEQGVTLSQYFKNAKVEWQELRKVRKNTWNLIFKTISRSKIGNNYDEAIEARWVELLLVGVTNPLKKYLIPLFVKRNIPLVAKNVLIELAAKACGFVGLYTLIETITEVSIFSMANENNCKMLAESAWLLGISAPVIDYKKYSPTFFGYKTKWNEVDLALSFLMNLIGNFFKNAGLASVIPFLFKVITNDAGELGNKLQANQSQIDNIMKIPNLDERKKALESFLNKQKKEKDAWYNNWLGEVTSTEAEILKAATKSYSNPNQSPNINTTNTSDKGLK